MKARPSDTPKTRSSTIVRYRQRMRLSRPVVIVALAASLMIVTV
jgi:hypothetical protein